MHLGPDSVLVASEIAFDPALDTAGVEAAVDAVEDAVRESVPEADRIYVEAESERTDREYPFGDAASVGNAANGAERETDGSDDDHGR